MHIRAILTVSTIALLTPLSSLAQEDPCNLVGYAPGMRPDTGDKPTIVSIGLALTDLIAISDLDQSVTLDMLLTLRWRDERLRGAVGCRFELSNLWNPDIQLVNSGDLQSRQPMRLTIAEGGLVQGNLRFRGTISNPRRMDDFPFDEHLIELEIMSLRYPASEVQFEVEEAWTFRRDVLTIPDWNIGAASATVENLALVNVDRTASIYRFSLPAVRLPDYYIYKVILPLTMIVMMSWAVFWIDPNQLEPQMALAATSVLTLIAFQFTMNDILPRVGYFTLLDKFILTSSILVFLALVEAVATGYLAWNHKERTAKILDRSSRWAFPGSFIVVVLTTLVLG